MNWPQFNQLSPNENYNFTSKPGDHRPVRLLIGMGVAFMAVFLWVYFQPANRGYSWLFGLLTVSVLFKLARLLHEWYHYWNVRPPVRPCATRNWTVDVLTTYCPGEPREMVINTLRAFQKLRYPHTAWLCDEANDPVLRQICADLGVRHVTRTDRTDAKAGNINNALQQATGEICLVIDPDHVPVSDFLNQILPYFEDPKVGFVQCAQGYYNRKESVVAFGASEQTYSFYGPMMTSMGQYGTAQAIGANCTFRRAALDDIGGHANGLSEDMHTAMRMHANGWESVYVPLPLSYGLVPATLSAYYKQQLKWSRGTFELLITTLPRVFGGLSGRQRLHYLALPLYYLLGLVQLIDLIIPICSLVLMRLPIYLDLLLFATVYTPLLLTAFLIRQYAQRWLIERHEAGFHLVGGILASGTWWVYALGVLYTLFRVNVPYLPTPKDDRPRNHFWLVLPNLLMSGATLAAIAWSIYFYGRFTLNNVYTQLMIVFGLINVCMLLFNAIIGQERLLNGIGRWIQTRTAGKSAIWEMRIAAWKVRYGIYFGLRWAAMPLFAGVMLLTIGMGVYTYDRRLVRPPRDLQHANTQAFYTGKRSATKQDLLHLPDGAVMLVPQCIGWPVQTGGVLTSPTWPESDRQIPYLTIDPDVSVRQVGGTRSERVLQQFLKEIIDYEHDVLLTRFIQEVARRDRPVLVSFMPEFDSPTRPWAMREDQTLVLYRMAWTHLVGLAQQQQAHNIAWVWCPTQPATISAHYPGSDFVHWIGLRVVNNPAQVPDGRNHSFAALFQPLHTTIRSHAAYSIRQKPILITRLESVSDRVPVQQWTTDALETIHERYPEIRGVIGE